MFPRQSTVRSVTNQITIACLGKRTISRPKPGRLLKLSKQRIETRPLPALIDAGACPALLQLEVRASQIGAVMSACVGELLRQVPRFFDLGAKNTIYAYLGCSHRYRSGHWARQRIAMPMQWRATAVILAAVFAQTDISLAAGAPRNGLDPDGQRPPLRRAPPDQSAMM
jgi:hypothetical protein